MSILKFKRKEAKMKEYVNPEEQTEPAGSALQAAGVTAADLAELQQTLNAAPVPESAVPPDAELPAQGPTEPATRVLTAAEQEAEEAEKKAAVEAEHAAMWANLDGKNPFDWPEQARNLYQSGCTCSLWGRSIVDMSPEQRILFVAYVDAVASDLLGQCKGLAMAMEMVQAAQVKEDGAKVTGGSDHG